MRTVVSNLENDTTMLNLTDEHSPENAQYYNILLLFYHDYHNYYWFMMNYHKRFVFFLHCSQDEIV